MAAEAGANRVTACEGFAPMARVAAETVARSLYSGRIKVVGKRSDELEVGGMRGRLLASGKDSHTCCLPCLTLAEAGDMDVRADVVVHEILDTELLGEGVLPSLRDAYSRLLRPGAVSIPAAATLYAQVFYCYGPGCSRLD
jgi:protein arginine N-methyltransferase 7